MRAIRNISQRLLGLALLALIPATIFAAGQTTTPAPKSFATSHSVVVIGSNNPLFDSLLQKDFPGVDQVNYFQQIKPLLAIIHNNTLREIKAYVVKWTITNSDGTTSTAMLPVMWEPPPDEPALTGTVTVLGPAGTGLGTQLVSPFFNWPKKGFSEILPGGVKAAFTVDARFEPLVSAAGSASSVHAILDAVIFGDGVCVGPDTSKLFERFQAEQQAQIDEAAWMLSFLQNSPSMDDIKDQLSTQIYAGRNSTSTDPTGFYKAARGRAAEAFLADIETLGTQYVRKISALLAKAKPMALQRLTGQ